jgi:carboxymethylenebutenolidase
MSEQQSSNHPAALGADMQAGVPYYGIAPAIDSVAGIKSPLLCHLAERDERVDSTYPAFEAALKAAAKLSWTRTVEHFKRYLA